MEGIVSFCRRLVGDALWLVCSACLRCVRAVGLGGLVAAGAVLILAALLAATRWVGVERARLAASQQATAVRPVVGSAIPKASAGLDGFREILTPHDDIPQVISGLFELAASQQIILARGEYRMQMDDAGGFLRYRISLPVKGQAAAIHGFIEQGLLRNRSLAFESVQFKRDKIESASVEARIQWTLFAQPKAAP